MDRVRRVFGWLAAVVALILVGTLIPAYAATVNAAECRAAAGIPSSASPGSVSSGQAFKYDECRFDRLDAAVKALQPGTGPSSSPSPSSSATPTRSPSASPTPSSTPTPTSSPTAAPGACTAPVVTFQTSGSAGLGQYGFPGYDASAEPWSIGGYNYAATMKVCSNDAWTVDVTTDNAKGDGAVKSYPSMRRIYHDWSKGGDFSGDPLLSTFPRLEVDWSANDPATCTGCIYDTAFDLWFGGIGDGAQTELMVWTHNVGQRPYGAKKATGLQFAGHTWDVWASSTNSYVALVPTDVDNLPSGTLDVKALVKLLSSDAGGRVVAADPKVGQVSFGVEPVSTGGKSVRFDFRRFTIRDQ